MADAIAYEAGALRRSISGVLHPEVHYGSADDGAAIAYATLGSGPVSVVLVSPMVSQLEVALEEPAYEQFISRLASWAQVVMFDRRGTGLSDRDHALAEGLTLARLSSDLRTVLDANGIERAVLFGTTFGAQISIRFAVDHPLRTQAIILVGGFAKLTRLGDFDFDADPDQIELWARNVLDAWGSGAVVGAHAPGRSDDRSYGQWAARLERNTCVPGAASALCRWVATTDVSPLLAEVQAPTLVIHRNGDRSLPVEGGRELAEGIPGAVYVELSGDDHTFFLGDQLEIVDEVITFLDQKVTGGSVRDAQRHSDRSGMAGIGWKSLTLSEQEVARLAAAGKTNAEIANRLRLSPHTIDGRLRRVFAKLGINNRVELTAEYARVTA